MTNFAARAIVITAAGSFTADFERLTGPVDSVAKLAALLDWFCGRGGLAPLGGPGQVWVIGQAACEALGWWTDDEAALQQTMAARVGGLREAGWGLIGELGPQLLLTKTLAVKGRGRERRIVQIVLEPFAPLITKRTELGLLEDLPAGDEEAAREVGRRVMWLAEHLGVLPMVTAASTGARIQDDVYRARKSGRGAVVDAAGVIPDLDVAAGDGGAGAVGVGELEPAAHWGRPHIDASEIGPNTDLALLDQRGAYLATAGSIELGFGPVTHVVEAEEVARVLAGDKPPFGVFLAVLPAGGRLSTPAQLPLPHPLMRPDRDVTAWITTESVRGLCEPIKDGGAGLSIEDLAIDEAWTWESSRRFLEDWAARLRAARLAAIQAGDRVLEKYLGAIYKQYVGRMGSDKWAASKMHHCQPVWRAAIIAHCRWRARRQAMEIYHRTGRWPIYTFTDSWRYLLEPGVELAPTDASIRELEKAGESVPLGRLVEQDRRALTAEQRELLLASTNGEDITAIVYRDGGIPTVPLQPSTPVPTGETPPAAPPPEPVQQAKKRRGKGLRERTYVGDALAEIQATVSPRAVADLAALVEQGKFSYLPDGVHHVSERAGVPAEPTPAPPVQPAPRWPVSVYTAAAIVAILLLIAAVIVALAVI